MSIKKTIWLILLIFTAACTADQPGEVVQTATSTLQPVPAAATPTIEPTSVPTSSLSAEGPWLLYLQNTPRIWSSDLPAIPAEFILINQDGSGRTSITLPECAHNVSAFLMDGDNSANYLAQVDDRLYIFRPSQAAGMKVYQQWLFSVCHTFFRGDEKGGLLASFYQESEDVSPELILFELPSGEILQRFPLFHCSEDIDDCKEHPSNWEDMIGQKPRWSPDGRYLAFVAIKDAVSSDLFVYDSQNDDFQRVTYDPNWVGPFEWSPDGTQIIMQALFSDQELPNDYDHFFSPYSKPPVSVWSVSVSPKNTEFLYTPGDDALDPQSILLWLDNKRFFAYRGWLAGFGHGINLRFVDMAAGTNQILFDGMFVMASYDPENQTIVLYGRNPHGIYLVSVSNGDIKRLDGPPYNVPLPAEWDENIGMFVSSDACVGDPKKLRAVDHQGILRCIPNPNPATTSAPLEPATYPAPNRNWSVSVKDGLWLETDDEPAVLVSKETAAEVIWCPDSSCLFFTVAQQNERWTLYHISMPDLTIEMVDEGIESTGSYQWLGGE